MSTLFDLGDSSDSEDDADYLPLADELSSDDEEPIPLDEDEKKASKKRGGKVLKTEVESKPLSSSVDEKERANDIYKSFLEEVAAEMSDKTESPSSGIFGSDSTTSSPIVSTGSKISSESSCVNTPEKHFEFAGETISAKDGSVIESISEPGLTAAAKLCAAPVLVTKISDSKVEIKSTTVSVATSSVKRKGLQSVLGSILNKKPKINTLQKSLIDWKSFKKEEGIEEDLEKYNRGKGGYIERQRFLQRSDLRSYEVERDMRMSRGKKKDT